MVGDHYISTGINLRYSRYHDRDMWTATAKFMDAGFCDDLATEGEIHTRYFQPIETAIDTCRKDAESMGIQWGTVNGLPYLYIEGDGESKEWPAPDNWREVLQEQAKRIGWQTYD